jgi:CRISPR system Cascade subunit CasA
VPASFDLINESFVPVVTADGTQLELGLRDTLLRAHEMTEVRDPSPLVTIALHRLLLTILHAGYRGPKNQADRIAIRTAGRFDANRINAYFEKWTDRFDLFHPTHPFLQRAGFTTKEPSGINRLAQELSRGNNAALFDHTTDDPPPAFTPAQAARAVIAEQAFAVGGGKSDTGNTTHAPLVSGAIVLAHGKTLFETLWLNLTEYDGEERPVSGPGDDAPIWERKPKPPHQQSPVRDGYLDYLVWPARTLALHPEEENGQVVVRRVSYAQGRKFEAETGFFDPMVAYFRTDQGDRPVRFNEYKDLWRDSASLFQFAQTESAQSRGPTTLHTLQPLINEGVLPRSARYQVSLIGLCTDKAKVLFWRHESLPLPLVYLDDLSLVESLKFALKLAEEVAVALRGAVRATAKNRLRGESSGEPDKDRVQNLCDAYAAEPRYWSRLERPFRSLLAGLAEISADQQRGAFVGDWFHNTLTKTAWGAFHTTVGGLLGRRNYRTLYDGDSKKLGGERVMAKNLAAVRKSNNLPARDTQPQEDAA